MRDTGFSSRTIVGCESYIVLSLVLIGTHDHVHTDCRGHRQLAAHFSTEQHGPTPGSFRRRIQRIDSSRSPVSASAKTVR